LDVWAAEHNSSIEICSSGYIEGGWDIMVDGKKPKLRHYQGLVQHMQENGHIVEALMPSERGNTVIIIVLRL
jgi:hypothetical protein